MPVIDFQEHARVLSELQEKTLPQVYLLFGDSYLCETCLQRILSVLLPDLNETDPRIEILEYVSGQTINEAVSSLKSYGIFSDSLVVLIKDIPLSAKTDRINVQLNKARDCFKAGSMEKALKIFSDILGCIGADLSDISSGEIPGSLASCLEGESNQRWFFELAQMLENNDGLPRGSSDPTQTLRMEIEKGFPPEHYLVMISNEVERKNRLYSVISEKGLVIDCSIPQGSRKIDIDKQKKIIRSVVSEILEKRDKQIDAAAFEKVFKLVGNSPRQAAVSSGMLADFIGDRKRITADDAEALLVQSRTDPIYDFTTAVCEKKLDIALSFAARLLDAGYHPMQLFSAIINNIRKLLVLKYLITGDTEGVSGSCLDFSGFKNNILPKLIKQEDNMVSMASALLDGLALDKKKGVKEKKKFSFNDSIPKLKTRNPYYLFKLYTMAQNFSLDELVLSMINLHKTDIQMKTSGFDMRQLLERIIIYICNSHIIDSMSLPGSGIQHADFS